MFCIWAEGGVTSETQLGCKIRFFHYATRPPKFTFATESQVPRSRSPQPSTNNSLTFVSVRRALGGISIQYYRCSASPGGYIAYGAPQNDGTARLRVPCCQVLVATIGVSRNECLSNIIIDKVCLINPHTYLRRQRSSEDYSSLSICVDD